MPDGIISLVDGGGGGAYAVQGVLGADLCAPDSDSSEEGRKGMCEGDCSCGTDMLGRELRSECCQPSHV